MTIKYKVGAANLPVNVKAMPAAAQEQWIAVFDSAFAKSNDVVKAIKAADGIAVRTKSFTDDVWDTWEVDKRLVSQTAAEYDPFGAKNGKGCASCQWFISPDSCMLVQGDISPTGMSKFYTAAADVTDEPLPINVYVVNGTAERLMAAGPARPEPVVAKKDGLLKTTFDWFVGRFQGEKPLQPLFIDKSNDQWRVFLVYSNSFKDNVSEIIAEVAHKEYVEWATANNIYPELQLWHAGPASRWGQVDFLDYVNGFAVSSALVDKGKEHIAEALEVQAKQGNLKVSHGYWGLKDASGTYLLYRDFEQSPLPANAEANSWTGIGFDVLAAKESDMVFNAAKRQWLKETAGLDDKAVDTWEASLKQAETALTSAGIARKEGEQPAAAAPEGAAGATTPDPLGTIVLQMKEIGTTVGNVMTVVQANKASVDAQIAQIAGAVQVLVEQVKKSQDDIVADAYKSLAQRAGVGHVASEVAAGTVAVAEVKAAGSDDWFHKIVLTDFNMAPQEAASSTQPAVEGMLAGAGMGVQVTAPTAPAAAAVGGGS